MKYLTLILICLGTLWGAAGLADGPLLKRPAHFPEPVYSLGAEAISAPQVELGRILFYDPVLSQDSTISCASCHSPYNAFAHSDHKLSHGIDDQIGTRNAPALFNLAWQKLFMWDGAINHLDMQALAPISHPGEMGENLAHVVEKLQRQERYQLQFEAAFGDRKIEGVEVLKALSQFQLTLVSAGATYDAVQQGKATFTPQEEAGQALFELHCASCHTPPLFTHTEFANNGLPIDSLLQDYGRGGISQLKTDSLQFKVPSLRNLGFSGPYMHDGRFRSLRSVLNHYSQLDKTRADLDPRIAAIPNLTSRQSTDLISFLRSLNDTTFVFNPPHQFPRDFFFPPNQSPR